MKQRLSYFCVFIILFLATGCRGNEIPINEPEEQESAFRIGFSMAEDPEPWVNRIYEDLVDAAAHNGIEIVYHDTNEYSTSLQLKDVRALIEEKVDYLVIFAREKEGIDIMKKEASEAGIPVILISDDPYPDSYFIYKIAINYYHEGELAAEAMAKAFKGRTGKILQIRGADDLEIAAQRTKGFQDMLSKYENLEIVDVVDGQSDRGTARAEVASAISVKKTQFNAVFAASDEEGIGAMQAVKSAGFLPGKDVVIVSIDGTQDTLKAIHSGNYTATVLSGQNLGETIIWAAKQWENGWRRTHIIIIPSVTYDMDTNTNTLFEVLY